MTERKHVKLFRHGRNQAILVPFEFELPANEATIRRDGNRLILSRCASAG